jgi:hypothetical protein
MATPSLATPFAPHVELHDPKPGDETTRELWESWSEVADAEKSHRAAKARLVEAERLMTQARSAVLTTGARLTTLHKGLARKLNLPDEPKGEQVP